MANGKKRNNNDNKEAAMVGAGLAALAAGAYFFLGPNGKKHQKQMKGWMVKMKGEVLEKLEDAKDVTEPLYNEIVDKVARTNAVAGKIPKSEIAALANDLKKQWRSLNKSFRGQSARGKRKSPAKKASGKRRATKARSGTSKARAK